MRLVRGITNRSDFYFLPEGSSGNLRTESLLNTITFLPTLPTAQSSPRVVNFQDAENLKVRRFPGKISSYVTDSMILNLTGMIVILGHCRPRGGSS